MRCVIEKHLSECCRSGDCLKKITTPTTCWTPFADYIQMLRLNSAKKKAKLFGLLLTAKKFNRLRILVAVSCVFQLPQRNQKTGTPLPECDHLVRQEFWRQFRVLQ